MGRIITLEQAMRQVACARDLGQTVVFTNGHFDLLHVGHIDYLGEARALGDVLIVGMNSDASTRALKGEKQPIVPQGERAWMLAGLACVDYVVLFDELDASSLIRALKPNIYVKGEDWKGNVLPEIDEMLYCDARLHLVPYVYATSTSSLIEVIMGS